MVQRKHPELKVVFDTSALYTGSASDLFNTKIESLIKEYSQVADLKVSWYFPKVVITEREYQMLEKGKEILPSIQKLERLLGHNLNITEDIIHERINSTISQQLTAYAINILALDISIVNWDKVIHSALYRIPPFEKGEREKGFRDALIVETFLQLVELSPKSPQSCRVVFVAGNGPLIKALSKATETMNNVNIYNDIENVKSLINTLASSVREELINKIKQKVQNYFFEKENKESLYFKEEVFEKIENLYDDRLKELPAYGETRKNETRYISAPRFVSKKKQRITWKTRINVVSKAYKKIKPTYQKSLGVLNALRHTEGADVSSDPLEMLGFGLEKEELVAEGRTTFEVTWSITVTTRHHLTNPKIESIDFIEINWEDKIE